MIQIAKVFSDYCVLQRDKNICVFGFADDEDVKNKSLVSARLFDSKNQLIGQNTIALYKERFELVLPAQKAQEECTLEISANGATTKFLHVSIGEVFLAGGQSNMEYELRNCLEGQDELKLQENPNVRFYYTQKIAWMDEDFYKKESETAWATWASDAKGSWSAVAYFFAKKVAKETGVTVGVIGCNWGGTSATAWIPTSSILHDKDLSTYVTEYELATKGKSIEQQCAEYDAYEKENAVWQEAFAKMFEKNPALKWSDAEKVLGKCPWPGPASCKNPYRPGGLYECMLRRVAPYTLRAVLWYQGESDDHKPAFYAKLFATLIAKWRTDWHDEDLPFLFVQLPVHRYKQDKDFKHWCLIREAQAYVAKMVRNTAFACSMDLGDFNDIHPRGKKVVAERLSNLALCGDFGIAQKVDKNMAYAPVAKSALFMPSKIRVEFANASCGLELRTDAKRLAELAEMEKNCGTPLCEDWSPFEIAGSDGIFYPANAYIIEENCACIELSSPKVAYPTQCRYAWYNYGPVVLYGKNNLPAVPFRLGDVNAQIDDNGHAQIQQIMTV